MSDDMKVPPGWVRLTGEDGETHLQAVSHVRRVSADADGGSWVLVAGETYFVTESPAEVAAMIAEAQRAEWREKALPVMAALMGYYQRTEDVWTPDSAVSDAAALLDAIERREREGE